MTLLLLTVLVVFGILLLNELWCRHRQIDDEFSRKFAHITIGSFVAFWPFFLSWEQIGILSLAFVIGVVASKYLGVFQAIHSVQRPTWGEILFAAAVGTIALVTQEEWIYAAAVLQMGLADGLAAVIGIRYGRRQKYLVFGHAKSLAGTLTFFVVSLGILMAYSQLSSDPLSLAYMLAVASLASLLENIAVRGLDNLLVPLLVAVLLSIR